MNYIHEVEIEKGLGLDNIQEVRINLHGKIIKRIYILTNNNDIVMDAQEVFDAFNGKLGNGVFKAK